MFSVTFERWELLLYCEVGYFLPETSCESARSIHIDFKKVLLTINHSEIEYDNMMFAFVTRFGRTFWCVEINNCIRNDYDICTNLNAIRYLKAASSLMTNCILDVGLKNCQNIKHVHKLHKIKAICLHYFPSQYVIYTPMSKSN